MTFHDLKDIVMIYSSTPEGKHDYTWEKAEITVWNPTEQKRMHMYFTGSERPNDEHPGKIGFNVDYVDADSHPVWEAFDSFVKKAFPNIDEDLASDYKKIFLNELVNKR